jgi:hypothetical protein
VLLKHKVLEISKEIRFATLISEDPIEEVAIAEGISWKG